MKKHLSKIKTHIGSSRRKTFKALHGKYRHLKRKYISSRLEHMFEATMFDDVYEFFGKEFDRDSRCKSLKPSQFRFG